MDNVRVLVHAPTGRDGLASVEVFRKAGLQAEVCASPFELVLGLKAGAGAVLIAEESIQNRGGDHAAAVVALWSSLAGRKPGWR